MGAGAVVAGSGVVAEDAVGTGAGVGAVMEVSAGLWAEAAEETVSRVELAVGTKVAARIEAVAESNVVTGEAAETEVEIEGEAAVVVGAGEGIGTGLEESEAAAVTTGTGREVKILSEVAAEEGPASSEEVLSEARERMGAELVMIAFSGIVTGSGSAEEMAAAPARAVTLAELSKSSSIGTSSIISSGVFFDISETSILSIKAIS